MMFPSEQVLETHGIAATRGIFLLPKSIPVRRKARRLSIMLQRRNALVATWVSSLDRRRALRVQELTQCPSDTPAHVQYAERNFCGLHLPPFALPAGARSTKSAKSEQTQSVRVSEKCLFSNAVINVSCAALPEHCTPITSSPSKMAAQITTATCYWFARSAISVFMAQRGRHG